MGNTIYWGAFIIPAFSALYTDPLSGTDFRIFLYLLSNINYTNNVSSIKQKEISSTLGIHKTTVSKSIKLLEEFQYIVKYEKYNGYMINPCIFYVGKNKASERYELRDTFDELIFEKHKHVRFDLDETSGELDFDVIHVP